MPPTPPALRKVSVYQDVVLGGSTALRGQRDCDGRFAALEPYLPTAGSVLDVGSNFGWFGWKICTTRPGCVVASVEADERSAAVQRQVLASNNATRICLLTHRAGARLARHFARAGQRFDAVLCLSVLHWIADHRAFLTALGPIAGRLLIEQPAADEHGAGVAAIRQEIGPIGPYLAALFPHRPVDLLARWPSHRDGTSLRELWRVGEPAGWPSEPSPGLEVAGLLACDPGWPPRSWWQGAWARVADADDRPRGPGKLVLAPDGLQWRSAPEGQLPAAWQRQWSRLPEHAAMSRAAAACRGVRRTLGNWARRLLRPGG